MEGACKTYVRFEVLLVEKLLNYFRTRSGDDGGLRTTVS